MMGGIKGVRYWRLVSRRRGRGRRRRRRRRIDGRKIKEEVGLG